jgi:hypothetical protein
MPSKLPFDDDWDPVVTPLEDAIALPSLCMTWHQKRKSYLMDLFKRIIPASGT